MLNLNVKQDIYNYLKPLKTWIDNNGSIYLDEVISDVAEHLDFTYTYDTIEKLLRGVCNITEYDNSITRINI